jgi:hypothetical protein
MADEQSVRSTRRAFLKGAAATGTGLAAAAYVKPNLRALGVPGALAQISDSPTQENPVDSSVSVSTDPSNPGSTLPLLPSTGDGGANSAFTELSATDEANDDSHVAELMALAVAGGLIGSRVVQTLRSSSGPVLDDTVTDSSSV